MSQNPKPVIVDLSHELSVIVHPEGIAVVGKFTPDTSRLTYYGALSRARNIALNIREIVGIDVLGATTFYIHPDWQSFSIVQAVSKYFGVTPRVLVLTVFGEYVDLVDFYASPLFEDAITKEVVQKSEHQKEAEFLLPGDVSTITTESPIQERGIHNG